MNSHQLHNTLYSPIDYMKHVHHIVPKYMGGDDSPEILTPPISVELHATLHKDLYEHYQNTQDFLAWKGLLKMSLKGIVFTDAVRAKISWQKKNNPRCIAQFAEARLKAQTNEAKQKRANTRAKTVSIIFPDGHKENIRNIAQFCLTHNIAKQNLYKYGKTKGYIMEAI